MCRNALRESCDLAYPAKLRQNPGMNSQFQITQSFTAPGVIDLGAGHPGAALLPRATLQAAAAQRLGEDDSSLLQYGLEQGDSYFRHALATFLSRRYGTPVDMERLFIAAGASQALDLICTLYTQPGDVVLVEEPTYFLALRIFADHRLRVCPVATDADGLDIEALETALAAERPAMLYTVPTHQNPAGFTLPLERRRRLVELSEQHSFLIVADEVYHLLSYGTAPPAPLASFAESGTVLGLGSFSKILAPGLRLGWVQAAPHHMERLYRSGLLDSGGGLNPFTSALVRVVVEGGWEERYLDMLRATYRRRIAALHAALVEHLGRLVRYTVPDGGYFFWLRLPEQMDGETLAARAPEFKVGFRPGQRFSGRQGLRNYIRLSFAHYEDADLAEGVRRLAALIAAVYP